MLVHEGRKIKIRNPVALFLSNHFYLKGTRFLELQLKLPDAWNDLNWVKVGGRRGKIAWLCRSSLCVRLVN